MSLELPFERTATGWAVRVPLHREDVRVEKRTVVAERVIIQRQASQGVERVNANVKREEVRVESHEHEVRRGDLDATQPLETTQPIRHHGALSETGLDDEPLRG